MKRALTILAAALLCAGCAPATGTGTPGSSATLTPTASPSVRGSLSVGGKPQAPGSTVPPTLGITWDDTSRTSALDVATRAMNLFARPTVADKTWVSELGQLLTPQALAEYQYVDPAKIPVSKVTGPGRLKVDEANGYGCHVSFPTNAGQYDVQLLRTGPDKPWQVNRITPLDGTK